MSKKTTGIYLRKTKLISMYKRIKRNKDQLKIWLCSDFVGSNNNRKYLDTLVKFDLIEKVNAVYYVAGRPTTASSVKGYRLVKK